MKLYDLDVSGNCYKVRLFAALIDIDLELRPVDFAAGEQKDDGILALNPFGELPILIDGDMTLRNSHAMLVYIARKHEREDWYPLNARDEAAVVQWLMVAENELARGPNDARLHDKFDYDLDVEEARSKSNRILSIMNRHLGDSEWLALDRPTIADIACFPYIALGHEGGVFIDVYPNVSAWVERIKSLPGLIAMPGI